MAGEQGGGGGQRGIVRIPIDSAEFDAFVQKFHDYQSLLEDQPEAWRASNKGIRQAKDAFNDMEGAFANVVKLASSDKIASPSNGTFQRIKRESAETERSWRNISKEIEKAGKGLASLARNGLNFASLGILGVGGGIVGGLGTGAVEAANDLAEQNAQNRALGLAPGEEKAFDIEYGRAGGDASLIAKIAAAKADPRMWNGLIAGGLTQDEIRGQDPEALAAEFLQRAGAKFDSMGVAGGTWASQTGVTDYLNTNQLRQAGSYNAADYQQMAQDYDQLLPALAAAQKTLDEATAEQAKFSAAFAKAELELEKAFVKLAPEFSELANDAADWVKDFADSGELKADIDGLSEAFGKLEKWAKYLVGLGKNLPVDQTQVGGGLIDAYNDLKNGDVAKAWKDLNRPITDAPTNTPGPSVGEGSSASEDQILDAIEMNESSGINGKTNPKTGAAGLYGIMPDNYQHDHIDPMDPVAARAEAARIYEAALNKYHDPAKALAAYDGFAGLDKDIAKYGPDWRAHIGEYQQSGETSAYLDRIEKQGIALAALDRKQQQAALGDPAIIPYTPPHDDADTVGGFPVVAYDGGGDQQQDDPRFKNVNGLNDVASNLKTLFASVFGEGAGSGFRTDDRTAQRIDRQGNTAMSPYNVNIQVSVPPGASTTSIMGGLPQ